MESSDQSYYLFSMRDSLLPFQKGVKMNQDLARERSKASFNVEELTNLLDDGPAKTARRRYLGKMFVFLLLDSRLHNHLLEGFKGFALLTPLLLGVEKGNFITFSRKDNNCFFIATRGSRQTTVATGKFGQYTINQSMYM